MTAYKQALSKEQIERLNAHDGAEVVYPLDRRTVAELQVALSRGRWQLSVQHDKDGWFAELHTPRGSLCTEAYRTPTEAVDDAISTAAALSPRGAA